MRNFLISASGVASGLAAMIIAPYIISWMAPYFFFSIKEMNDKSISVVEMSQYKIIFSNKTVIGRGDWTTMFIYSYGMTYLLVLISLHLFLSHMICTIAKKTKLI